MYRNAVVETLNFESQMFSITCGLAFIYHRLEYTIMTTIWLWILHSGNNISFSCIAEIPSQKYIQIYRSNRKRSKNVFELYLCIRICSCEHICKIRNKFDMIKERIIHAQIINQLNTSTIFRNNILAITYHQGWWELLSAPKLINSWPPLFC